MYIHRLVVGCSINNRGVVVSAGGTTPTRSKIRNFRYSAGTATMSRRWKNKRKSRTSQVYTYTHTLQIYIAYVRRKRKDAAALFLFAIFFFFYFQRAFSHQRNACVWEQRRVQQATDDYRSSVSKPVDIGRRASTFQPRPVTRFHFISWVLLSGEQIPYSFSHSSFDITSICQFRQSYVVCDPFPYISNVLGCSSFC